MFAVPQPIPGPSRSDASAAAAAAASAMYPYQLGSSYTYGVGSFNNNQMNLNNNNHNYGPAVQFYPSCSPGTLMGPLDIPHFDQYQQYHHHAQQQQHLPQHHQQQQQVGSYNQMMSISHGNMAGSMSKDYSCCGQQLRDLHALVEHFEEQHVVVLEEPTLNFGVNSGQTTTSQQQPPYEYATLPPQTASPSPALTQQRHHQHLPQNSLPPSPQSSTPTILSPTPTPTPTTSLHHHHLPPKIITSPLPSSHSSPEMDLEIDMEDIDIDIEGPCGDLDSSSSGSSSGSSSANTPGPSPPLTPVLPFDTTSIRRFPTPSSVVSPVGMMGFPGGAGVVGGPTGPTPHHHGSSNTMMMMSMAMDAAAFNRYAGYTEFSAMLPGTLASPSSSDLPMLGGGGGYGHSRQKSSLSQKACLPPSLLTSPTVSTPSSPRPSPTSTPTPPNTSSTSTATGNLLHKPFRCPKENCNKSYKQANGLKYHLLHGSCNFSPIDTSLDALSSTEIEARLKPYVCAVPVVPGDGIGKKEGGQGGGGMGCGRRYKNMNGLRYHYLHSGQHGAIGMAMLASGSHPGVGGPSGPTTINGGMGGMMMQQRS